MKYGFGRRVARIHDRAVADLADCGAKTPMKGTEQIRCKECGHRVMYKPRTHKSEYFGSCLLMLLGRESCGHKLI